MSHYSPYCLQNVSVWSSKTPDIIILHTDHNWNIAYAAWKSGQDPTSSPDWKKGIYLVFCAARPKVLYSTIFHKFYEHCRPRIGQWLCADIIKKYIPDLYLIEDNMVWSILRNYVDVIYDDHPDFTPAAILYANTYFKQWTSLCNPETQTPSG